MTACSWESVWFIQMNGDLWVTKRTTTNQRSINNGVNTTCLYEWKHSLTLGGLRILSVGGVCLLKVIAGSEWGKQVLPFQFYTQHCFNPVLAQTLWLMSSSCVFADKPGMPHCYVTQQGAHTWSSVVHPCSSGDRRGAAGRAGPVSPRQTHSAAPTAAHSSPPGPWTQAHPEEEDNRSGPWHYHT